MLGETFYIIHAHLKLGEGLPSIIVSPDTDPGLTLVA